MNPSEYIKERLKSFINDFSNTRVRYEFDSTIETHFIEIVPNEVYHLDQTYIQWESQMFDNFIHLFPAQNICFISDDAIVGLDKIDFELTGEKFILEYSSTRDAIILDENPKVNFINDGVSFSILPTAWTNSNNGYSTSSEIQVSNINNGYSLAA